MAKGRIRSDSAPTGGGPTVWGAIDAFPGHSPLEALINAYLNSNAINTELFGWATGSLWAAAALFAFGWAVRRDWAMLTPAFAIVCCYSLYYFAGGPDFGARYWYPVLPSALVLTARALLELDARSGRSAIATATVLSCLALVTFFPWRATDKYYRYWTMSAELRERSMAGEFDGGLVIVRGDEHGDYSSARVYNSLENGSASPIFAYERRPELREKLIAAFPGRSVWLVDGPSITGRGYRAVRLEP